MDLVICEIFNKQIHGFDDNNDPTVLGHYIVCQNFSRNDTEIDTDSETNSETSDSTDSTSIFNNTNTVLNMYKRHYRTLNDNLKSHTLIRNYNHIITRPHYIQLQIAKVIYLSGLECVAILKTFWLKLIQRTWQKIYKQRCDIIALRKSPSSQAYRERHGKWADNCFKLPSLRGMMVI